MVGCLVKDSEGPDNTFSVKEFLLIFKETSSSSFSIYTMIYNLSGFRGSSFNKKQYKIFWVIRYDSSQVKHKLMIHKLPTLRLLFSFSRLAITLFKLSKTSSVPSSSRLFSSICSLCISEIFSPSSLRNTLISMEVCQQRRLHAIPKAQLRCQKQEKIKLRK